MDAYGVFQGGGAKGYAHVGALKAAEERGIRFTRLAGTSAGAIVASLVAAGYRADELLDPTLPIGFRGALDIDVDDVLDPAEYRRVRRVLARLDDLGKLRERGGGVGAWWRRAKRRLAPLVWARRAKLAALEARTIWILGRDFGLTGTERLVDWLDGLLSAKLPGPGPVTFGDLGMTLRVVAANLRTGAVHEFGIDSHEDLAVAPAVVASACFPLFFRPFRLGNEMLVDGGLVSNLPAWLFDREREDDASFLPTIGFRLIDDTLVAAPGKIPTTLLSFLTRMGQTLQSGARNLEERRIEDYYGIDVEARIPTLSFATVRREAPALVLAGRRSVEAWFEREVGPQDPARVAAVLRLVAAELARHYEWTGERVRAAVIVTRDGGRTARTLYTGHMEVDGDDRLAVRTDGIGAGAAIGRREPVYIRRADLASAHLGPDRQEFASRPASAAYIYAVPIFADAGDWWISDPAARGVPFAALVLDKEAPMDELLLDPGEQDTLANVAAIVGEEVRDRIIVRAPHGPEPARSSPSGPEPVGWTAIGGSGGVMVSRRKVRDAGDSELGTRIARALTRINDQRRHSDATAEAGVRSQMAGSTSPATGRESRPDPEDPGD